MAGDNIETHPIAAFLPNVPVHISNFSDRAFRSARSSLFKFTTQTNQYSEQATENVRQAIRPFYQSGSAYRLGAVADATNIGFSFCTLYYLFEHSYQQTSNVLTPREFKIALNEFHEAEKDPTGFALAVVFTIFLITTSTLGSTYDEKRDPKWVKYFDFWTSLRDALKQIKWSTKGLWAALVLCIKYNIKSKDVLLHIFFPLAIVCSALAVLNRIFLRWIRDSRKDLVISNLELIDNIRSPLQQLDKLPRSFQGYEYSLLVLKDTKEVYYVNSDAKPERIVMVGFSDFNPDDIASLASCMTDPDLNDVKDIMMRSDDSYKEINFTSDQIKKIETVLHGLGDSDLAKKLLEKWHVKWDAFSQEIDALRTKNVQARMKQHLSHMLREPQTNPPTDPTDIRLHFIAEQELAQLERHDNVLRTRNLRLHNTYVYFSQADGITDNRRLYYVNDEGQLELQPSSRKFHREYLETLRDPNVLSITAEQLTTLTHPDIQSKKLGHDYTAFVDFRQKILEDKKIRDQDELVLFFGGVRLPTKYVAPISAGLSAISDGAYYYIYATTMAMTSLSPFWALIMLGSAALLFTSLFVTRIAEELDFERRLSVTIDRAQVELSKKSCVFLREKLMNLVEKNKNGDAMSESELHALIRDVKQSIPARSTQLAKFGISESNHTSDDKKMTLYQEAFALLWNELRDELTLSKKLQDQLRAKLNRSYWAVGLEGIQHGMSVQGAIASFMFMMTTFSTACPPMLILGCMMAGMAAVALSCLHALFNHYLYLRKVARTNKALSLEFEENLVKVTSVEMIQTADRDTIEKNMNYINNNSLEAPTDSMMMEWMELFRVFFLGLVKGYKAFVELFARLLEDNHAPVWMLPLILFTGAVSFAIALLGRAAAKGFAIGRPDSKADAGNSKAKAYGFWDERNTLKKSDGVFSSAYLPESASDSDGEDEDPVVVRYTPVMSAF